MHDDKDFLSEAQIILLADQRIEKQLDSFEKRLPDLLKPMMFEVAEKVGKDVHNTHRTMMERVLNVNLEDSNSVSKFQQVQVHAEKHMKAQEDAGKTIRRSLLAGSIMGVVSAILTYFGINKLGG